MSSRTLLLTISSCLGLLLFLATNTQAADTDPYLRLVAIDAAGARTKITDPPPMEVPGQKLEADFNAMEMKWLDRVAIAPLRERAKGQPWADDAVGFATAAFGKWHPASPYEFDESLAARGRELAKLSGDPLVRYLAARLTYLCSHDYFWHTDGISDSIRMHTHDIHIAMPEYEACISALAKLGTARGFLRLLACDAAMMKIAVNERDGADKLGNKGAGWLGEALSDGSYKLPGEEELLVGHVLRSPYFKCISYHSASLRPAIEKAELSTWSRLAIYAVCDWGDAIKLRKSEGMEEGDARLRETLDKFALIWKMRPDRPEAASMIFRFSWNVGFPGNTAPRLWFDRVVSAEFDQYIPYDVLLTQLRTDWRGEPGQLAEFGRNCVATKRFDTAVPLTLLQALRLAYRNRLSRTVAEENDTAAALLALGKGMVESPVRAGDEHRWQSLRVVWAWLAGHDEIAAEILKTLPGGKLHTAALHELRGCRISESGMRGDIALRLSRAKESYERSRELSAAHLVTEAMEELTAAEANAPGDPFAKRLLKAQRQLIEFELQYAKGDWTKLPLGTALGEPEAGEWDDSPDGNALILKSSDRSTIFRSACRVGAKYEMRGEFTIGGDGKKIPELGFMLRPSEYPSYMQCHINPSGSKEFEVTLRDGNWGPRTGKGFPAIPDKVKVPRAATNRFYLQVDREHFTLEINDRKVWNNLECNVYGNRKSDFYTGICGFASKDTPITFQNWEARRLE